MVRVSMTVDVRSVSSYVDDVVALVVTRVLVVMIGAVNDTGLVAEFAIDPDDAESGGGALEDRLFDVTMLGEIELDDGAPDRVKFPIEDGRPEDGELDPVTLAEVSTDVSVLDGDSDREDVALGEGLGNPEDGRLENGGCEDDIPEECGPGSDELEVLGPDVSVLNSDGKLEDVEFHSPVPLGVGRPEDGRPEDGKGLGAVRPADDGTEIAGADSGALDELEPVNAVLKGERLSEVVKFHAPVPLGEGQPEDERPEDDACEDGNPVWLELKNVPDTDDNGEGKVIVVGSTVVKLVICEVAKLAVTTVVKLLVIAVELLSDTDGVPDSDEDGNGETTDELALALGGGSPVDGAAEEVMGKPELFAVVEDGGADAAVEDGLPRIELEFADNEVGLKLDVSSVGALLEAGTGPEDGPQDPDQVKLEGADQPLDGAAVKLVTGDDVPVTSIDDGAGDGSKGSEEELG